jgi:hypothetical protein
VKKRDVKESSQLDELDLVRLLSFARVGVGLFVGLMPRRAIHLWLGEAATPGLRHAARSVAGRDIALGLGTLVARDNDGDIARWLEAQAMSDATDALATAAAFKHMPRGRRWLLLAMPIGATILGLSLAADFDDS